MKKSKKEINCKTQMTIVSRLRTFVGLLAGVAILLSAVACVPITQKDLVLKLNDESINLLVGGDYLISQSTDSDYLDQVLEAESADDAIAEVDGLKIVGIAPGDTTVTVRVKGKTVSKTIVVHVDEVPVGDYVYITSQERIVPILGSIVLVVDSKDQAVEYSTSDPETATVSQTGVISGLKEGKVDITVALKSNKDVKQTISIDVKLDPMYIFSTFHVENPIVQYVSTYGYNPDIRYQYVYGSVSRYFNAPLNLIERFASVTPNKFAGMTANPDMLTEAEGMKLVRSGILMENVNYITYHDTGNHTPNANALANLNYMVGADNASNRARSWHYTVDENCVYYGVPDNEVAWQGDSYTAYSQSIGVETCVDFGSDLFTTWHRTAKLMAQLLVKYDLSMDSIKQHYFWNQKECPQTLRKNNLYQTAISLVEAEYIVQTLLKDYTITFESLNPEYVDDRGRVINLPTEARTVGYVVTISKGSYSESKTFRSVIKPTTGGTVAQNPLDVAAALEFDERVFDLPIVVTTAYEEEIIGLYQDFQNLTNNIKKLIISDSLLMRKLEELLYLSKSDNPLFIREILGNTEPNGYVQAGYIEIYNSGPTPINLEGYILFTSIPTQGFTMGPALEGIHWYQFKNVTIRANSSLLIQGADINGNTKYLPLADVVTRLVIGSTDGTVALVNTDQLPYLQSNALVDLVGYGTCEKYEYAPAVIDREHAIARIFDFDSNHNSFDFIEVTPAPMNSMNRTIDTNLTASQIKALKVDIMIKYFLSKELSASDEADFNLLKTAYEGLSVLDKNYLVNGTSYANLVLEMESLINPELKVINQLLAQIPLQIVDDYTFPTVSGVSYRYAEGADSTCFNLQTGKILKTTFAVKLVEIIVSYNGLEKSFEVNFGLLTANQSIIFTSGATKPAAGPTKDGTATYQMHLNAVGFAGVSIIVNNKVYFVGKNAYINLSTGINLTKTDLRPRGGVNDINNIGFVNGTPTTYAGTGALYHNTSSNTMIFDPSDTYGRNNSGDYGYFKVIFRPDGNGSYSVVEIVKNSGTNEATDGTVKVNLLPGDFLWCPHSYEANTSGEYGTMLVPKGTVVTTGYAFELGTSLDILFFKFIQ